MEGADFLLTIGEIALAIVTFTAVVLVLRQLVGGSLSQFHLLILLLFALCGFGTLFFCLLPFLLAFLGLSTEAVWRAASGTMAVAMVAGNARGRSDVSHATGINSTAVINQPGPKGNGGNQSGDQS